MAKSEDRGLGITRRAALGLGGAGAMALLAGCARGTFSVPAPAGVLTLNNDNATWAPGYDAASAVLKEKVGYTLGVRAIPNVSNYQQVIRMSAQTGSTTDMFKWWNGYRLKDIIRGDMLADLSDVWDSAMEKGWLGPELRDSFRHGGKQYGVPLYKSYYVMIYSKKAFADNGLSVPTTFDELLQVAGALKAAGVTPIQSIGASSWESLTWFQQLVGGIDADYYAAVTTNKASYEDETAQQAMDIWATMYADGLFSAPDKTLQGVGALFAKGAVGMMLYATWEANSLVSAGLTDADVGMFPVPPVVAGAKPVVFTESGSFCVPVNGHKNSAAKKVTEAWLSDDVQQAWIDFLGDISANPNVLPKPTFVRDLAAQIEKVDPVQLVRYWEASPPPLVEGNVQDLSSFMVNPSSRNAKATLRSMQNRAQIEWKAWDEA